jgi:Family of unknown function (DUF5317)
VILLAALLLGLLAGWGWALWHREPYRAPEFKYVWLVPVALVPQVLVMYVPGIAGNGKEGAASAALPFSLLMFLVFVWLNRSLPGMPVLLAGLILNLLVISANGGWMPISPQTASHLPGGDAGGYVPGDRFGAKDILLMPEGTRLEILSDRFLIPPWLRYPTAFSLGDVFVAVGAFWLLARQPAAPVTHLE